MPAMSTPSHKLVSNLTYVRGPYIFTGSATDLEISCECIKAVRFHASIGKLHDDKPSSCSNTSTVTP